MTAGERPSDDRTGYPPPALTAAVLAIVAVVLAVWGIAAIVETAARAVVSYTPVEAIVVDERVDEQPVVDRRGRTEASFRVVVVETPDGARADVRSDDLDVGAAATVYRDETGAVFEHRPTRPGLLEWGLCAALVAAAFVIATASVRGMVGLRRPS